MTRTGRPAPLPRSDSLRFDEVEPDDDCICGGCAARRRARRHAAPVHEGGHAAARSVRRRAAVLMAAVGTALGGGAVGAATAAPVPTPGGPAVPRVDTPQGEVGGLYGESATEERTAAAQPVTRASIIERAQRWVDQKVPYSMSRYWSDGYRQDCSGFVSMAWGLGSSQTTWTLPDFAERITKAELQPGDVLIHNDPASPRSGSHVTVFGGWTDAARTRYVAYEQTSPGATRRVTPYAYWSNSATYVPYRYKALTTGGGSSDGAAATAFPGADKFGPGADNAFVTRLGEMLVRRGGGRFYTEGPGPRWSESDRRATEAFQLAQGWRGGEADGVPGKDTWDYLVNGKGRDIAAAVPLPPPPPSQPAPPSPPSLSPSPSPGDSSPAFPGPGAFGPGTVGDQVELLGGQLVRKGFGDACTEGPGPRWTDADRSGVRAFQEAAGWSGAEADGYPGPDTWRVLFS
ncbi:peptidoglycan-binding protein [Kitasatospora purpeofusca]|uniref:peptidoglycan-binding protein n=1 Tax=Kitasatospora purpeofusca TaxID=67352 RepID=UPI00225B9313|nr:peptidoglycan-binding protein [Kitasatospora purpeofusca]MCX4686721.1 peptidoglycan-binding protein [Kitasatospora purpeofusca]